MKLFYRPTWIEIDLDRIKKNVQTLKEKHPDKQLLAVVKANAYGHGDVEVSHAVLDAGAVGLAVSSLDEGLHLRQSGVTAPILILGAIEFEDVLVAADSRLSITVMNELFLEKLSLCQFETPLNIHLKLNTGMNRLGFDDMNRLKIILQRLQRNSNVKVEGVFTHFATADDVSLTQTNNQVRQFEKMLQELELEELPKIHVSNTAATLRMSHDFDQLVRVGLGIYGLYPDSKAWGEDLKPALSLYSRLTQVRWLEPGECVGYGATYEAESGHWMGVIPIGYADGWWRDHQGRCVMINGQACEIIGRVCMDQLMVKLPYQMEVGDRVTLIGDKMPIYQVANELETITYEVLCGLSDRIPRVYLSKNQPLRVNRMRFQHKKCS